MNLNIFYTLNDFVVQAPSPFTKSTFKSQGNFDYIAGAFFLVMALLAALYIKRAKRNLDRYKNDQLVAYNENHSKHASRYEDTSLYIPFWERMKSIAPVMFLLLFVFIAITFFVGHPIQSL